MKKAVDNKVFENGTIDGYMVAAIDGPKLVIGFEMYKSGQDSASKDEGELNVAKRLLSSTVKSHKRLMDVVVYDAHACNSRWTKWSNRCDLSNLQ